MSIPVRIFTNLKVSLYLVLVNSLWTTSKGENSPKGCSDIDNFPLGV